jgi:hypothetical protein
MTALNPPDPAIKKRLSWAAILAAVAVCAVIQVRWSDGRWIIPAILVCVVTTGAAAALFMDVLQRTRPAAAAWVLTAISASLGWQLGMKARDEWATGRLWAAAFLASFALMAIASVALHLRERLRPRPGA